MSDMKSQYLFKYIPILFFFIAVLLSCNNTSDNKQITAQDPQTKQIICPKGLSYSDCANPEALHGQIMVHNMTDMTFDVKLSHHENVYEIKQIAPGDGWTFVGALQGKRFLTAIPSTGGNTLESSCTVIGNTQHQMNITSSGLNMADNMVKMKMVMYKSSEIDGCTDFHCLKCGDRNKCSREDHCDMPDCGHKHGAVTCHGGVLFYLRSSEGYTDNAGDKSCLARAEYVATRINQFMDMMDSHNNCDFIVLDKNKNEIISSTQTPTIWFIMKGPDQKVISISNSDLAGYAYRSNLPDLKKMAMPEDQLSKKIVAQWWASNLKDHFSMMVMNEAPSLTTDTQCGTVLLTMWEKARKLVPSGDIPMSTWSKVVDTLSKEEKSHLYLAAQIVPIDFNPI
jgi:hypothetical protein